MRTLDDAPFSYYSAVVWKWKWLILTMTAVAVLLVALRAGTAPTMYKASAVLAVARPGLPDPIGEPSIQLVKFDNVLDILTSESTAAETIERFALGAPPSNVTTDRFVSDVLRFKVGRNSELLTLTVTIPDRKLAAEVVDFLAHKAIDVYAYAGDRESLAVKEYVQQSRDQARRALVDARKKSLEFRRVANLDRLQAERKTLADETTRLMLASSEQTVAHKISRNTQRLAEIDGRIAPAEDKAVELAENVADAETNFRFWSAKLRDGDFTMAVRRRTLTLASPPVAIPIARTIRVRLASTAVVAFMSSVIVAFTIEHFRAGRRRGQPHSA